MKISKEELENLYRTKRTADVARELGISIPTLIRHLKANGIAMKSPGWGARPKKLIVEE
ncbi:MAG: hypothetical protein IJK26_04505 [Clostridia bacterium]|nr:hypothetical protein [Clostridia bacterium]